MQAYPQYCGQTRFIPDSNAARRKNRQPQAGLLLDCLYKRNFIRIQFVMNKSFMAWLRSYLIWMGSPVSILSTATS